MFICLCLYVYIYVYIHIHVYYTHIYTYTYIKICNIMHTILHNIMAPQAARPRRRSQACLGWLTGTFALKVEEFGFTQFPKP